jgi:hypothetical protein
LMIVNHLLQPMPLKTSALSVTIYIYINPISFLFKELDYKGSAMIQYPDICHLH